MGEMPEGLPTMAIAAVALHEIYTAYVEAGFTESQAMQLVCAIMEANVRGHNE